MDDEKLINELAKLEREALDARDPCWEAVVRGELDMAQAQPEHDVSQEELELARVVFEPLDDAFEDKLTAALVAKTKVVELSSERKKSRRSAWSLAALATAAAAAAFFVAVQPGSHQVVEPNFPPHELWVQPAAALDRGDTKTQATSQVSAGSKLRYFLRPQTEHAELPEVWSCLRQGDTLLRPRTRLIDPKHGLTLQAEFVVPPELHGDWTLTAVLSSTPAGNDDAIACRADSSRRQVSTPLRVLGK